MNSINRQSLGKMLHKDTIALNVQVGEWQEAVRKAGDLLVNSGAVEPRYVDAMIETVKSIGAYIVIMPGVALPHARPEDGVRKPCMSLVTLKTPVNFGNKDNDPVSLVIAFGTIDNKAHLDALSALAKILGEPEKLDGLLRAASVQDVEKIISGTSG